MCPPPAKLLKELRELILAARGAVAQAVNSGQVVLYWQVGHRLRTEVLGAKRAGYGERIVAAVAARLTAEFGRGFTDKNLRHMIRFAEAFPDREIVYALSRQLSWTQFRSLIYLDDPLKRDFYAEMCRIERWNTRTLQKKIGGMLFERTALSRKPEQLAREELMRLRDEDRLTPDLVFRDPYVLDFLQLQDSYSEKDLEAAILREIEAFILELGVVTGRAKSETALLVLLPMVTSVPPSSTNFLSAGMVTSSDTRPTVARYSSGTLAAPRPPPPPAAAAASTATGRLCRATRRWPRQPLPEPHSVPTGAPPPLRPPRPPSVPATNTMTSNLLFRSPASSMVG